MRERRRQCGEARENGEVAEGDERVSTAGPRHGSKRTAEGMRGVRGSSGKRGKWGGTVRWWG